MKKFEAIILISPENSETNLKSTLDKFEVSVTEKDGKIINSENWGLRDLSYDIKKYKKAFYKYYQLEIDGNKIEKITKNLNQNDNIIRHLFIKVNKHQELPTLLNYEKK